MSSHSKVTSLLKRVKILQRGKDRWEVVQVNGANRFIKNVGLVYGSDDLVDNLFGANDLLIESFEDVQLLDEMVDRIVAEEYYALRAI